MRLYYTGAQQYLGPQASSNLSLGGFPSSSQIPVGGLDEVFGSISQKDLREGSVTTKAVVLKNTTANTISGAEIWYENHSEFPVTSYRIALIGLSYDSECDEYVMESINSSLDKPLNGMFIDCRDEEGSLVLPDIAADSFIGIWIERTVNQIKGQESLSNDFLLNAFDVEKTSHKSTYTLSTQSVLGQHFTIDTRQNQYVVWFDDASGNYPQIAGNYELILINGVDEVNDSTFDIITKVYNKLSSILGSKGELKEISVSNNTLTIENQEPGKVNTPTVFAGLDYQVVREGVSDNLEEIEDVELILQY